MGNQVIQDLVGLVRDGVIPELMVVVFVAVALRAWFGATREPR